MRATPDSVREVGRSDGALALRYDSAKVSTEGLSGTCLQVLEPPRCLPSATAEELVEAAIMRPLASPPLAELARPGDQVAILVSGKDRVTRADVFVPLLLRHLRDAGVPSSAVTIYMATGTHIRFTDADRALIFGNDLPDDVRIIAHDCRATDELIFLGTSTSGNEIWARRDAFEANVKILTGRITHHYFAGFTGGRKAVLPGVSGFETIKQNHRKVLTGDDSAPRHPNARSGVLRGNPVHEEMLEAATLFRPTFLLNTVLNTTHELTSVWCGDPVLAHEAGCDTVAEQFTVRASAPAQAVIASCGGAPYDCSFVQALKAIFHAAPAVADGGGLLLLAKCPEGVASGFLKWDRSLSLPALARTVLERYDLSGHNTYLLREVLERIHVVLASDLPEDQVRTVGLTPARSLHEGWTTLQQATGNHAPGYYVVPFGNVTAVEVGA